MTNPSYTTLKGFSHWKEDNHTSQLRNGIINFYNWGFLTIGGFTNITKSPTSSGVYGGDRFRLSYVNDPRESSGKVWQSYRSDWVWESGLNYSGGEPQSVNIYVNGTEYETTDATYGHYIDYRNGKVVFDSPQATGTTIEADYSVRDVTFVPAERYWFRELLFESYEVQREDYLNSSGGKWNLLSENRVELPIVGVELVDDEGYIPMQLGGGQYLNCSCIFYVLADNPSDRDQIKSIISNQNDKTIWLPDRKVMKASGSWPVDLDYKGRIVSGALTFPATVEEDRGWRWRRIWFSNTRSQNLDTINNWLYGASVRTTITVPMPQI